MKTVRRRYLALKVETEKMVDSRRFMDAVWSAVVRLFGEYEASKTGLSLIDYYVERNFAVIRVAHSSVDIVRAALATMTKIDDNSVAVHILVVSGTIKALFRKLGKDF